VPINSLYYLTTNNANVDIKLSGHDAFLG